MYTVGGKEPKKGDNLSLCLKFDISLLKWVAMSSMNKERFGPGLFDSRDGNVLYAFGGQQDSVERIVLNKRDAQWQELDVTLPDEISGKYGFSIVPSWKF